MGQSRQRPPVESDLRGKGIQCLFLAGRFPFTAQLLLCLALPELQLFRVGEATAISTNCVPPPGLAGVVLKASVVRQKMSQERNSQNTLSPRSMKGGLPGEQGTPNALVCLRTELGRPREDALLR